MDFESLMKLVSDRNTRVVPLSQKSPLETVVHCRHHHWHFLVKCYNLPIKYYFFITLKSYYKLRIIPNCKSNNFGINQTKQ